ncbi:hypothetical protein L249_8566 [Ophiocordyceps polyrhachis-furcata BCC 54312]|uniref:Uncharacterized protein n=1 Tax=Ophiocordyceps polyrhachis-furcata BCC 54312 TaxID=1330021 RepID=A0A367L6P4_9HYPO|nr:hypothetical protein L249_8566 [Ophiocordyceps polyrhachis-furcata BCC 54312]
MRGTQQAARLDVRHKKHIGRHSRAVVSGIRFDPRLAGHCIGSRPSHALMPRKPRGRGVNIFICRASSTVFIFLPGKRQDPELLLFFFLFHPPSPASSSLMQPFSISSSKTKVKSWVRKANESPTDP